MDNPDIELAILGASAYLEFACKQRLRAWVHQCGTIDDRERINNIWQKMGWAAVMTMLKENNVHSQADLNVVNKMRKIRNSLAHNPNAEFQDKDWQDLLTLIGQEKDGPIYQQMLTVVRSPNVTEPERQLEEKDNIRVALLASFFSMAGFYR